MTDQQRAWEQMVIKAHDEEGRMIDRLLLVMVGVFFLFIISCVLFLMWELQ